MAFVKNNICTKVILSSITCVYIIIIKTERFNYQLRNRYWFYFWQDLASVPELEKITKEQPGLMEKRNVGSWIVHRCCNCSMYTHAVHREYGAALVLINNNILVSFR